MKKYQYRIALASLLLLFITSCSDFLDVVPQDKILENESYSNEAGIQTVHNGIYLQLAEDDLYGKQLTMDAVEILGVSVSVNRNIQQALFLIALITYLIALRFWAFKKVDYN